MGFLGIFGAHDMYIRALRFRSHTCSLRLLQSMEHSGEQDLSKLLASLEPVRCSKLQLSWGFGFRGCGLGFGFWIYPKP